MSSPALSRRRLLRVAGTAAVASAAAGVVVGRSPAQAAVTEAHPFDLNQVRLTASRWLDNQNRTMGYLRFVDADRLLHTFRLNAGLPSSAQPCGGWEDPGVELRGHSTGHLMSGLAQAYASTGDSTVKTTGDHLVSTLAACQAAAPGRGFHTGYLSAFPETFFDRLESGQAVWAPWYTMHKIMAGLLDQYRLAGNSQALTVLTNMAGWVDWRTGRLSYSQMQSVLDTEFGGMNAVLTDLYLTTNDVRWLTAAQRFDHAAVFNPLAAGSDQLNGLHANTNIPKWIGAAREYRATGTTRYRDIATNAWNICVGAHSYVIGGNSVDEHFKAPQAIAAYLTNNTCENCNSYNMLKLTRELFMLYPDRPDLFDYYERTLLNQMVGQQNPNDSHGHVVYFTPLNPGGRRGVSTGNSGYCTDYNSFWCDQGTGWETHTKLADSIYFFSDTTLIVNLFLPSVLNWSQRGITVTQTTSYPVTDTTTLQVTGNVGGSWSMRVRIPGWAYGASVSVNGVAQDVAATPGGYAVVTRSWTSGDTVTVRLPMQVLAQASNDNPNVSALTYGPVVLAGNYGNSTLSAPPALNTASISRTSSTALAFSAAANGATVNLGPFYDAHGFNYTVYWTAKGQSGGPTPAPTRSATGSPSASASASASVSASVSASASASTTPPSSGATAVYSVVSSWPGAFQGQVTVTAGASPIQGWTVAWTYPNGQTVTQLWNGTYTQSGTNVTVSNASYNGALAAGGSATFGFIATVNGTNNPPTSITCTTRPG